MRKILLTLLFVLSLSSCAVKNADDNNTENSITVSEETVTCSDESDSEESSLQTSNVDTVTETSLEVSNSSNSDESSYTDTEANMESVSTSGYDVTVEELMPIIKTANYDMYIIKYGGDWFNLKDGHYVNYGGTDLYDMFNSMYEVFSEESGIAQDYISSLKCYSNGDELLISKGNMRNFTQVDEDIFNIDTTKYQTVDIDGGSGANPTFLSNEFEITNRAESSITLKNTAYYSEENDEPIQIFEYDMVFEDGTWKFNNFERWY